MKKLLAAVVLGIMIVTGCAPLSTPALDNAEYAAEHFPGTTIGHLWEGQMIYEKKCNNCHFLKDPEEMTLRQWDRVFDREARRARLDSAEAALVYRYVASMSVDAHNEMVTK